MLTNDPTVQNSIQASNVNPVANPSLVPPIPVPTPLANPDPGYQKLLEDEHQLLRSLPTELKTGVANDGIKIQNGPGLPPLATPGFTSVPNVILPTTPKPGEEVVNTNVANPINNEVALESSKDTSPAPISAPISIVKPINENVTTADEAQAFRNQLDDLLTLAIEKDASDLHIAVDYPPQLRIDGRLIAVGTQEMTAARVEKMFNAVLDERLARELAEKSDVDFSYPHKSGNRFRVNFFFNKSTLAGAFRLIPSHIKSIADLHLPEICYELIKTPQGLILLTGPTGSGKSTSIAAMIQEINLNFNKHIITIEDPIEYVFPKGKAMVNQRELGQDAESWPRALRELLRQDPNVVLVGEMRDYETIASTITVAETGHLVFATLHTNSASQTIDRIIDVFPAAQQNQVRSQLANVIVAVIAQRLVPIASGGRRAVFEVLVATPGVKNAIRDGKTYQIDNMIQTNAELGMITLEKSLLLLIKEGTLTIDQAMSYTARPDELMSLLNSGR